MKITRIELSDFKLFKKLTIKDIPSSSNLVVLVGPNGSGKSCIFDAFNSFVRHAKKGGFDNDTKYFSNIEEANAYAYLDKIHIYDENNREVARESFQANRQVAVKIYGRTSYRFTKSIAATTISVEAATKVLHDTDSPDKLIDLDGRLVNDVQKALGEMINFAQEGGTKTAATFKLEMIGQINDSLSKIFPTSKLRFEKIIEPFSNNSGVIDLLFSKGSKQFTFQMLSSGEKEVFDILFNFHRRKDLWLNNGIYFVDEPELHLNTKIQGLLLEELYRLSNLINCQLWIATHSIGFMKKAQDLKRHTPEKICILEFEERFVECDEVVIEPILGTREDWKRIFITAIEELTDLVSPEVIIYCEGRKEPDTEGNELGVDAEVYNIIFGTSRNDSLFVSSGGQSEPEKYAGIALKVLSKAFRDVKLLVLKDRDIKSDGTSTSSEDREAFLSKDENRRMLKRIEIENYLFDKEVVESYCVSKAIPFDVEGYNNIITDITNQEVKSRANEIMTLVKITDRDVDKEKFKRLLAGVVNTEMQVYKELYECIFG